MSQQQPHNQSQQQPFQMSQQQPFELSQQQPHNQSQQQPFELSQQQPFELSQQEPHELSHQQPFELSQQEPFVQSEQEPLFHQSFNVGDIVDAQWTDGKVWMSKIIKVDDNKLTVKFFQKGGRLQKTSRVVDVSDVIGYGEFADDAVSI
jgi:hypothetical protein